MEFGICFDTHIDKWDLIRYVEERRESPLHQPRKPDSDLCCGQWSQGMRSRRDVR